MSGDPVRAALEAACQQDAFYGPGKGPSGYDEGLRQEYAQIIAAFLRALPVGSGKGLFEFGDDDSVQCLSLAEAAAAVEAAAKGEK